MASWKDRPVIIVGGGIGGLSAALALERKGIPSQLVEQAPEFKEIGAGIQLGPNVFRMFEVLGLTAAVSALAAFPNNLIMLDSVTGEEVTRIPLGDAFRAKFGQPYALIHRADLHNVLLDACRKSSLVRLDAGQKVVKVDETARRHRGAHRERQGVSRRGADRRRRAVVDHSCRWWLAMASRTSPATSPTAPCCRHRRCLSNGAGATWCCGPARRCTSCIIRCARANLFNLVATFHSDRYEEGWDSFGDPAELHERFAKTCEPVRTLLNKIESWRMWVLCDRPPIKDWSKGRITLLGDAAHPMLQYLAQGAGMSIEDAVCLADRVVAADGDYAAAFRAYQQARYLRTGRVQIMARVYGEFYHASGVAKELRNMMLSSRSAEDAMDGMAWLYGEQKELTRGVAAAKT